MKSKLVFVDFARWFLLNEAAKSIPISPIEIDVEFCNCDVEEIQVR